ncbi:MAG: DnaJ domain-containing protein [Deltaproteobacteria bacterium]|nr:DnaJ domain-containing protein [Deltaproteobacteria bacterium]
MSTASNTREISSAFKVLFGADVEMTDEFLRTLVPSDLKETFRKKAMELHPDRARIQGRNENDMAEHFKAVTQAYSSLLAFLSTEDPSTTGHRPAPQPRDDPREEPAGYYKTPKPGKNTRDHFWNGQVPENRLLLGQYLYYSGIVSWRTLINAISWQRRQRPSFGRIATTWKFLTSEELHAISTGRLFGEKIGGSALRLGYMTPYQRSAVLGFQRWLQRPIGEYFAEREILQPGEIRHLVQIIRRRNARFGDANP